MYLALPIDFNFDTKRTMTFILIIPVAKPIFIYRELDVIMASNAFYTKDLQIGISLTNRYETLSQFYFLSKPWRM